MPVPFGSLSVQQQNALKSIRNLYPDETQRAKEAYKYLNNQLGVKQTAAAPYTEDFIANASLERRIIPNINLQLLHLEDYLLLSMLRR